MFRLLLRTTRLLVFLLVLVIGISCRKHARHHSLFKDEHPAKKFNIVTQGSQPGSMMVTMKGMDGTVGSKGATGDPGSPGLKGPPGPPGLKGTPGVCTKDRCESNELKALIQRVLELEKYVKDKQNQTKPSPPQGANAPPPKSPKAPVPPASTPGQGQPASGSTQKPYTSPPQPPKVAALPAPSPVPSPVQGQPAPALPATSVPTGSPQVIWSNPAPPPVSPPLPPPLPPPPFGLTIQSTLEAPGGVLGGNGQVDIQGVVTPQVSVVQGYPGNTGTVPGFQRGFKKSSILSNEAVIQHKHVPKKPAHHSAVHHKTRTHTHTS